MGEFTRRRRPEKVIKDEPRDDNDTDIVLHSGARREIKIKLDDEIMRTLSWLQLRNCKE